MGQLVPRPGERVGELVRVLVEAPRDRLVDRVHPQREVGRRHHGRVPLRRVVRVRHDVGGRRVRRSPLPGSGRALGQLPLVAEQGVEVAVVPLHRVGRPGALQAAGDRVAALAAAEAALPAQALLLDARALGLGADERRVARAVALAEGVPAGDERDGLFVVHRHARERLSNVPGRGERIRVAVRAFRVHVDQAHLHGGERVLELPVAGVALVPEPLGLRAPVDVLLGLPDVLASSGEAERPQPHRLDRAVAREDHQVGPGDLAAVLLLDRPEQPARLVEVGVVGPAVERREAQRARAGAAAAVADAVGAGAVPRHADEERPVVAVVGRPPVLRRGHQLEEVPLEGLEVELRELLAVVEVLAHGVRQRRVLAEHVEVQLAGPPVPIRRTLDRRVHVPPVHDRAPVSVLRRIVANDFFRSWLCGSSWDV